MRTVPATDAKAHLAELLRTVERGETVAITRHGRTIAHVVPARSEKDANHKQAVARFAADVTGGNLFPCLSRISCSLVTTDIAFEHLRSRCVGCSGVAFERIDGVRGE